MKKFWICTLLILSLLLSACATEAPQAATTAPTTLPTQGTAVPTETSNTPTQATTAPTQSASETTVPVTESTQSTTGSGVCTAHRDSDDNGVCDQCSISLLVTVDFYAINDLHGKIDDGDSHPGVDELTTYLKNARWSDDHALFLSAGDMWQGSAESNMTHGNLVTDWMNALDFTAMAMGNHEYDWGADPIADNADMADFPFLAINIYDRSTDRQVSYCRSSVLVDRGDVQIGVIGAIGDCYSSISADKVSDVYFKTGAQLTSLVKAESQQLREQGADYIVYVLHDGYGSSQGGNPVDIANHQIRSYYDAALSNGYVDLVFEGHTHQRYILRDEHGVYHLQCGGDNKGISHVEVRINHVTGSSNVTAAELVQTGSYVNYSDDPIVDQLLDKYADQIEPATQILGTNAMRRHRDTLRQKVADLYYQVGMEAWGDKYDIVLGGGFISVRSPGYLAKGDVTYGMLQSLFPFDNQLMLCSVKGKELRSKFFETTNDNYFIAYGEYGSQIRENIDPNATYYVIVDSYSAVYAPNKLTIVEEYTPGIYARDLMADFIKGGGWA